tara:strand:- start:2216 stop:2422 length:207 start_codon:yes stop_codon:yes gene_type:complete
MESNADDKDADAITATPYPITNGEIIALPLFNEFLSPTSTRYCSYFDCCCFLWKLKFFCSLRKEYITN